jgi:molybdopterin synthase sulfur carrier subunit
MIKNTKGARSMRIKLNLLKPFSDAVGKKQLSVEFNRKTLGELLLYLVEKYPKMGDELLNDNNEITDYVSVFINDKPLSVLDGIETNLNDGDELLIFVPISGG